MWRGRIKTAAGIVAVLISLWQTMFSDPPIPVLLKAIQSLAVTVPANFSWWNTGLLLVGLALLLSDNSIAGRAWAVIRGSSWRDPDVYIRGKTIRLTDMIRGLPPIIRERTFEDCVIIGPAIISYVQSGYLHECIFEAPIESILWKLPSNYVVGVIGLENCTFRRCRFQGIGIAGTEEQLNRTRTALTPH